MAQPANDSFTNRIQMVGLSARASSDTTGSTFENEDSSAMRRLGAGFGSVWFSWTAPETADLYVSISGSFDYHNFFGDSQRRALEIGHTSGAGLKIPVKQGVGYFIGVAGHTTELGGFGNGVTVDLRLDVPAPVELDAPKDGQVFVEGEPILLSAHLTEQVEAFGQVEFVHAYFLGASTPFAAVQSPPFDYLWTAAEPGIFSVSPAIRLSTGAFIGGVERTIYVLPRNASASFPLTLTLQDSQMVQIVAHLAAGTAVMLEASADLLNWNFVGQKSADPTGIVKFDQPIVPTLHGQYFQIRPMPSP